MTDPTDGVNTAPGFHLRTLGTVALTRAGETVLGAHGHHKRRLALLSVLAASGDRGRSRDQLLLLFWPEATQARARHSLDQLLYALRNSVSEEVFAGVNPVRLNQTIVESDLAAFLSAVDRGDDQSAVALYNGAFLDGFYLGDSPEFEQWVEGERARLAHTYAEALERLARGADAERDNSAAIRWWRMLAETDPLSGQYTAGYMRALANAGDEAGALRHAERHSAVLARELGVEAGADVTNLVAALRARPKGAAALPIDPVAESSTRGPEKPLGHVSTAKAGHARRRWITYAAGILIAVSVAAMRLVGRTHADRPAAERSIVVLPLTNVGGDPRDAALVDGLSEELISVLAKLGQLKVIARTSAFAFKNSNLDARHIADSLGVKYVLNGSVQKDSAHVRVRIQLVDARDGTTKWAESYDGELRDVFRMQSDVAGAVARELDVRLGAGELARIKRGSTANPAAYEAYLNGNDPTLLRTDSGVRAGLLHLERAIALDPAFAAAFSARGRLLARSTNGGDTTVSRAERLALAEQSVLKALALDDSLADAHASYGLMLRNRFDLASAERELERAIALEPTTARFHEWLVQLYITMNRPVDALTQARRALELDPLSPTANAELAHALVANDRPDEALAVLAPLAALRPPLLRVRTIAAQAYARKGMWSEAVAQASLNLGNSGPSARAHVGYLLARAGRTKEAKQILASMLDQFGHSSVTAVDIATIYTGLGDSDQAFAWIKRIDDHDMPTYDRLVIVLDDLKSDARIEAVRRRLGVRTDNGSRTGVGSVSPR